MKKFLVAAAVTLCACSAIAGEHLIPERSQFTGGPILDVSKVLSALNEAYDRNVLARAIVIPARSFEYAVGVRSESDGYKIFHLRPRLPIMLYNERKNAREQAAAARIKGQAVPAEVSEYLSRLMAVLPEDYKDVEIERCQVDVDPKLAQRLLELWEGMLVRTRFPKEAILGFDGVTYHFSMPHNLQDLTGKIWSPPAGSNTGMLVDVTETMVSMCTTGDRKLEAKLEKQVDALSKRLKD